MNSDVMSAIDEVRRVAERFKAGELIGLQHSRVREDALSKALVLVAAQYGV